MKIFMCILCAIFILCGVPCFSEENAPYVFAVGKITVTVPNDYFCAYWDGIKNERVEVDNKERPSIFDFNKDFFIIYFRKDGNFVDPDHWGYEVSNLPVFTDYVNGISEIKPKFFVETMRRNKFKGINICETLTLGWYEVYDKSFSHQFIFTDDEYFYCINITMYGGKFDEAIESEMPDYFTHDKAWVTKKRAELRAKFDNYQLMPKFINDLLKESNAVFNNIII
jgi:hypothetical protein